VGVAPAAAQFKQALNRRWWTEEEILALAQATVGGDQAAAAQLVLSSSMILQVQAGGGVEVRKKWLLRGSTSIQKRGVDLWGQQLKFP
jgi:hypothetical protein